MATTTTGSRASICCWRISLGRWRPWNQLFTKSVSFRRTMMKLSLKATRFVIEALAHYQKYHDLRLRQEGLSPEDASDLANDRQYLEAIQLELEKYHEELMKHRGG